MAWVQVNIAGDGDDLGYIDYFSIGGKEVGEEARWTFVPEANPDSPPEDDIHPWGAIVDVDLVGVDEYILGLNETGRIAWAGPHQITSMREYDLTKEIVLVPVGYMEQDLYRITLTLTIAVM
ncbi:hypothetical protein ACMG4P_17250 [Pseudovibrio denitrificans]|uniref:hypothetical protein n=1 Tax=Pseudovibrio denitrificans TaxID=258256 RepID=UPI0039BEDE1D